jgi:hypothetical protein
LLSLFALFSASAILFSASRLSRSLSRCKQHSVRRATRGGEMIGIRMDDSPVCVGCSPDCLRKFSFPLLFQITVFLFFFVPRSCRIDRSPIRSDAPVAAVSTLCR